MSAELKTGVAVNLQPSPEFQLTTDDQAWLASFGVDRSWQDDPRRVNWLSETIATGSRRLDEPETQTTEAYTEIIDAREEFMRFANIPDEALSIFKSISPTIIPLDTFINTQRTMSQLGLDVVKVISTSPLAIGYAPETVRAKFKFLTEFGLNAVKIINAYPATIGYGSESIRAKFDNLTELGIDAAKVINTNPATINYAPETVKSKFNNLTELGLDAAKVINVFPAAVNLALESVRDKMKFLDRSARILRWEYSVSELVGTYPAILGFNNQKLRILRRIAAHNIEESSRTTTPKHVRTGLVVPLEKYILELANTSDDDIPQTLIGLTREASKLRLDAKERKEQALELAPGLGRIGTMYKRYRNL